MVKGGQGAESSTCFAYIVREVEHYLLYLWQEGENTTCYVYMAREGEHYLLCLYGKGEGALLVLLILQGIKCTTCTCYAYIALEGEHYK